jgi:hypothetical protein
MNARGWYLQDKRQLEAMNQEGLAVIEGPRPRTFSQKLGDFGAALSAQPPAYGRAEGLSAAARALAQTRAQDERSP